MEDAQRRLGIAVADVASAGDGGSGTQRRPVYESRKSKSLPKHHENVQSEENLGETQVFEQQLEDGQSNGSLEDTDGVVVDVLESGDEQITPQSSEENNGINDDAWENKNFDEFDALSCGESPSFGDEEDDQAEENHMSSAALIAKSSLSEDIAVDVVSIPLQEGSSSGIDRELRAPICCILGHVDAGKTKLLDCIGEAMERTSLKAEATIKVPGLLVIDTPGHQSFSNMRIRRSSLCDVAVVVVDITRGLENQTIESLDLLKHRNVWFVVALNKVDRLYGWKTCPNAPIAKALKNQSDDVRSEFKWRVTEVVTQLKESGFNAALYYENKKIKGVVSIVPTSVVSCVQEINKANSLVNEDQSGESDDGTAIQEMSRIKTCKEGVYVQASSLGTLEAIIEHLKSLSFDIPVSGCNLGPVHKQDVMKATAMLKKKEEYAAILAFDVKVMPEAFDLAAESGVKIFVADTVYKLVDSFTDHIKKLKEEKKKQYAAEAVFPCTLKILPNHVYHKKDPIVCDVQVLEGVVKVLR
ncbi:unnamed protein product [Urochloa decumbens]|uniref:Tr-type G domain-containing protein n=1 Tax=Urochloa decumbens TaxID=240449 RepID=A0ABC8VY61_9POAL